MNLPLRKRLLAGLLCALLLAVFGGAYALLQPEPPPASWSAEELAMLDTLRLGNLPPLPPDPSNAVGDDPRAARLGHRLFFDTRLSGNGEVSCATCHQPELRFTDGLQTGRAIGRSPRNTMGIIGTAYSPWLYWDGRKDSQWSQALSPLEDPAEHGGNRMQHVRLMAADPEYRQGYEALFGPLPDVDDRSRFPEQAAPVANERWRRAWESMTAADRRAVNQAFANIGKLIAAYERRLMPGRARFDQYASALLAGSEERAEALFSEDEVRGLRLFIGEARCADCHNGPLLTNHEFHNTGLLPPPGEVPDRGRIRILDQIRDDPFNCLGRYSDAGSGQCPELTYMREGPELIGALRTPSLRNLEGTAPYMHKGQLATLTEVLEHYNDGPPALIGHNEAKRVEGRTFRELDDEPGPLGLDRDQLRQLEAFLETLQAPPDTADKWLQPPGPASNEP